MTVAYDISAWLQTLGLEQYAMVFVKNGIDLDTLGLLAEKDLQELGVLLGHRKKLRKAIVELNSVKAQTQTIHAGQVSVKAAAVVASIPAGERRQLTVMFCDMVGFTALAGRVDPEVLQGIIRIYEDACAVCITRYNGYVFQRLGDGVVAFFGYPLAHEDEAERAIRAGLAIIESLSALDIPDAGRLQVRIGVATGLVVISGTEQSAAGETMNLASRLQGVASPGSIVVSERVQLLAGGAFDYADLGAQELKGIAEPARVWRIVGVSDAASRFEAKTRGALTPLVGREHEIAVLLERWRLAQDGHGQVVVLSGEPGIGKSRISSALRERLLAEIRNTLRFQCSSYHVNSALYPIIDNFERVLKFGRDEALESKLDKLEALLVRRYQRPVADARLIAIILSMPCEARYGSSAMTPQRQKDETIRALVDIIDAAARLEPTVMFFEDAHWADPTSLEVLERLIDRAREMPLLIVLTHRPEFQAKWIRHGHATTLNLSKLNRRQSNAMVSTIAGGKALPPDLLEQILAKTDGVPLYVEELTRTILESGKLEDAGERYEYVGGAHTLTIPATLRDSLAARLDRVQPVKEIAQIGAVIGREFSYELIAGVAPHSKTELDRTLEQLIDSGLAFRRGTPPEAHYTFKHALVRDAAYDSLLKSRRRLLHATIARVLEAEFPATKGNEPELLAHHLTEAGETEAAIDYWRKAGERARQRLALNEAISHLSKGMELIATLPQSAKRDSSELDLHVLLGMAWVALRGWGAPDTWSHFHSALGLAKPLHRHETLVPIYYGLWANVAGQGRVAESLVWIHEMLATAETSGDPDLLVSTHRAACTAYHWRGDFAQSCEHGNRVLALYREEQHHHIADLMNIDPKTAAILYASLRSWILGYPDRASQLSADKDEHARWRGRPFNLGYALTVGSPVWDFRCEPAPLLACVEEAERVGREHGLPLIADVLAQIYKGIAWLRAGQITEGVPLLRGAFEKYDANGGGVFMPYYRAALAEGLARGGDVTGGLSLIDESLAQIARPGWEERCHLAEVLRLKGWMLSLQDEPESAEQNYLAALDVAREQQAKSWELRTATSLATLWRDQGKPRAARDLLAPIYDWFTEGFDTKDLQDAKALLKALSP